MHMKRIYIGLLIIAIVATVGCGQKQSSQMANPASVYCEDQGGRLEILDEQGGQRGICHLKDGTTCDEWQYYRGECPKKCGECPQLSLPSSDFCPQGKIVEGSKDECGCQGAPTCEPVACTQEAKVCPDGSSVGRVGPDCEFAACPELEKHYCTAEQRLAKACTMEYNPVCGWFSPKVRCIKAPCAATSGNDCVACIDPNVEYWTQGECPK